MINHVHVIDLSVTAHATDPSIDMHSVIKIGEVRNLMNSDPIDGSTTFPALSYRKKLRIIALDLSVTIHARLCRWDIGML